MIYKKDYPELKCPHCGHEGEFIAQNVKVKIEDAKFTQDGIDIMSGTVFSAYIDDTSGNVVCPVCTFDSVLTAFDKKRNERYVKFRDAMETVCGECLNNIGEKCDMCHVRKTFDAFSS